MKHMRAAEVRKPGGPLVLVESDIQARPLSGAHPGAGLRVCHSDVFTKERLWPGLQPPRVPGHEIAGIIDALGPGVSDWAAGQRVGVGWHGGHFGGYAA